MKVGGGTNTFSFFFRRERFDHLALSSLSPLLLPLSPPPCLQLQEALPLPLSRKEEKREEYVINDVVSQFALFLLLFLPAF